MDKGFQVRSPPFRKDRNGHFKFVHYFKVPTHQGDTGKVLVPCLITRSSIPTFIPTRIRMHLLCQVKDIRRTIFTNSHHSNVNSVVFMEMVHELLGININKVNVVLY